MARDLSAHEVDVANGGRRKQRRDNFAARVAEASATAIRQTFDCVSTKSRRPETIVKAVRQLGSATRRLPACIEAAGVASQYRKALSCIDLGLIELRLVAKGEQSELPVGHTVLVVSQAISHPAHDLIAALENHFAAQLRGSAHLQSYGCCTKCGGLSGGCPYTEARLHCQT